MLTSLLRRPDPVVLVTLALLCAAVLVMYLQHRALADLDRQTALIIQKISEQAADEIVEDIRQALEGPVRDTLRAVNHPELRDGRFDLVLDSYEESLLKYPHVERFFLWSDVTEARYPGEVLFFGERPGHGATEAVVPGGGFWDGLWRDPPLGRFIARETRAHAGAKQVLTPLEYREGGRTYDILVRQFWVDAARDRYFALLGFVVDAETAGPRLLPGLYRRQIARRLDPGGTGPRLELEVLDHDGHVAFASSTDGPAAGARRTLSAQSLPPGLENRLNTAALGRTWTVHVGPAVGDAGAFFAPARSQTFWLASASVALMLVALGLSVRGQRRAVELARMQAEFASHVSHQLKTPLALLTTVTETLALDRVRSPEKLNQYVDILRTETAQLSTLVDQVLEFCRADGRGRRYEVEPVALEMLVRETVDAVRRRAPSATADIRVEVAASPVVAADPAAIEQVLVNLLDNAVKYSAGAPEVFVRLDRRGADAVLEVADRGIGIDPADRRRIFERFYRGSGAARDRRGFGLGLAIVKEIVAAHRGRIEVESAPGRGSRFRVLLPAIHPPRPESAGAELAGRRAS